MFIWSGCITRCLHENSPNNKTNATRVVFYLQGDPNNMSGQHSISVRCWLHKYEASSVNLYCARRSCFYGGLAYNRYCMDILLQVPYILLYCRSLNKKTGSLGGIRANQPPPHGEKGGYFLESPLNKTLAEPVRDIISELM